MEDSILNIFTLVFFGLLLLLCLYVWIALVVKRRKTVITVLFKHSDAEEGRSFPTGEPYYRENYFVDCLVKGKNRTLRCRSDMYNHFTEGESYTVILGHNEIKALDKKYF